LIVVEEMIEAQRKRRERYQSERGRCLVDQKRRQEEEEDQRQTSHEDSQ